MVASTWIFAPRIISSHAFHQSCQGHAAPWTVAIYDPEAHEYPQRQTGKEKAVALPSAVAVATRSDRDGDVAIEVWGDKLDREQQLEVAYEGELLVTGNSVNIGSVEANDVHQIPLGRGRYHLKVLTASSGGLPDRVYFVVTRLG